MSGIFGWDYPPGVSGVPQDDEVDWIEEAKKWIKQNEHKQPKSEEDAYIFDMINGLYAILEEEGLI